MITLLLLACAGGSKQDDTAAILETGEPVTPAPVEEDPVCASPALAVSGADTTWDVETDHYVLHISGFDEDEARNLGALAETAWAGLARFFGAEIPGPLSVFVAADQAEFEAALAEAGIGELEGAGGYYDPNGDRAYLYRQPTAYYSRVLLLHEIVHQYQAHAEDTAGQPGWYIEGLAEALGRHHWDGACLQLRVRPLLSWEDMAAQARDELDAGEPDLQSVLTGGSASRALSQELLRLLSTDPDLAPAFAGWRAEVASGAIAAADLDAFEAAMGPTEDILAALEAFVPEDQEPLSPVWLDWIPEAADAARGWAEASSAARIKGAVREQSMRLDWPAAGAVGAVYGYDPTTGDVELALLSGDGGLSRFAVIGGSVTWDSYGVVSTASSVTWTQTAGAAETDFSLNADSVRLPRALDPAGGLALYGAEAVFSELSWE